MSFLISHGTDSFTYKKFMILTIHLFALTLSYFKIIILASISSRPVTFPFVNLLIVFFHVFHSELFVFTKFFKLILVLLHNSTLSIIINYHILSFITNYCLTYNFQLYALHFMLKQIFYGFDNIDNFNQGKTLCVHTFENYSLMLN